MTECVRSCGSEDISVSPLTGTMGSPENGKLELAVSELDASGSPDFVLLVEDCSSDDGDGVGGGTMISSHFSVKLTDCTVQGDISVLFIHVMVSSS